LTKKKTKVQVIKKRVLGIGLKIALFFLLLLFFTTVIISIPAIQTRIINRLSDSVFEKINHNVDLEYINIRWFDTILIRGLLVYDTENEKMIEVDQLILDFKLRQLITESSINFDKAILHGASVNMLKNGPDGIFNLNFFIDEIKDKLIKKKPRKDPRVFITDKIILTESRFHMYRDDKEIITHRFDQYHFTLQDLDANLLDFTLEPGIIDFNVTELQCVDSATGLDVKYLKTKFKYTRQSMVFQNMELEAGRSTISQSMVFSYLQPSSVKEFVDSVKITSNVKKSVLYSKDLGHFAPALKKYNEFYHLKGFMEGPIKRFNAQNISLRFGLRSELEGYISMYGLPNFNETFIDARITDGEVSTYDLAPYTNEQSLESISKFGSVRIKGGFSGFPVDFVSNASFETEIGDFSTDINLKVATSPGEKPSYSGNLVTENFDLGVFLNDSTSFQYLDMNGSINGSGFSRENAKFDLVSNISRLGINGYEYVNIQTDAVLADQFFNGSLMINDPNLQFNGNMSIDLNQESEIIKANAQLDKAVLDTMGITSKPALLSSALNVDMRGLSLDEILGEAYLENTNFIYNEQELVFNRLNIRSEKDSLSRSLKIQSPYADIHIFGDFNYSTLFTDIKDLVKEYQLIFRNDSKEINAYYASNQKDYSDYYYLDYDINLKNINPVVNMFNPDFLLSKNTSLIGSFTGGPTKLVQLESSIDTLKVENFTFEGNQIELNTQKSSDTTLVYATYDISSKIQKIDDKPSSEKLNCEVDWSGNTINFLFDIDQSNSTNYAKTSGKIEFLPDTTMVSLRPSEINVIDKIWKISEQNLLMLQKKNIDIRNLSIYHGEQKITFNGVLSENPDKNLFISIRNFDMANLNPLIPKRLDGTFNGFIDVKNYFNEKEINSRINVRDFSVNEFLVGNVIAYSEFDNAGQHFDVNLNVNRKGIQTMLVEGIVKPSLSEEQLDLEAKFTDANLNLLEPFFEDYISEVTGQLNGEVKITGAIKSPRINGSGATNNFEFTLDYFNTHYALNGIVNFEQNYIDFPNFILTDIYGNTGNISGRIMHNGFKELQYDFNGNMNEFLVLNTTSEDNSLYYGTAYATGDINIFGKEKSFNISANAVSERGTRFYIPLEGSSEAIQEDFINFISAKDTLKSTDDNKVNVSGINLNLDLEVTPDAYCEIIFDLTAGDIIRGRGNGKLNLQIDTKGDFNMFGDYVIEEGGYNFTLYNIINKEFSIEPGSQISWIGDPYEAILDINANYEQLASLLPILRRNLTENQIENNPELRRKYPAKVFLDITGNLSYPEIEFDIGVEDYPKNATYAGVSVETMMTAFKNKLATDEQELKRQVFSLIILKKFSEENAFNVGGSVESSVSEFISNQISYWITQFDENLVVDVDLSSLDNEAFNTFQLRMSYSFLDGRLRVTRDGGFTDQTTGTSVASILGDWSVEYLLSPDGMLRVKIYNRTNYNTLDPSINQRAQTAGFSLMHTKSFDEIKEIFKNTRNKNRPTDEELEEELEETEKKEESISRRSDKPQKF
jgi:hypothetical protein